MKITSQNSTSSRHLILAFLIPPPNSRMLKSGEIKHLTSDEVELNLLIGQTNKMRVKKETEINLIIYLTA